MHKKWIYTYVIFVAHSLAASSATWSTPQSVPSISSNVIFPTYDPAIGQLIVTWIDDITYPSPNQRGFSSLFNGTSWSSPQQLPINGVFVAALSNAYDPALGKIIAVWSDTTPAPYSSTFNGTTWSPSQPIPDGGGGSIFPFSSYDRTLGKLVAVWADGTLNGHSSIFDGTNWSAMPQTHPAINAFVVYPSSTSDQFLSTWVDIGTNTGYSSIFDGTNWSSPQTIATNVGIPNMVPLMPCSCTDPSGTVLVLWSDFITNQINSSTFDGINWSSPQAIPGGTASSMRAVFSTFDPVIGRIVAVWQDSIMMQGAFSEFDGTGWTPAQAIPDTPPSGVYSVAYDPSIGKLVALWVDLATNLGYYSIFYVPPISFSGSGNLARVANYINFVGQSATMQPILALLHNLNQSQLTSALSSISNARNAFLPYMAGKTAFSLSQAVENRAAELRWTSLYDLDSENLEILGLMASLEMPKGSSQTAAHKNQTFAIWAEGLGSFAHQNAQDQNPAFDANTYGTILGMDYYGEKIRILSSLSYAHSHIHDAHHAGKSGIDSYAALILGTGSIKQTFIEVGCAGIYNHYKSDRHIFFPGFDAHANASFSGWQAVPHFAVGYDLCIGNWFLEPFASADCAVIIQDQFSEHGAAPLNVKQHSNLSELFQARGGLRAFVTKRSKWGLYFFQLTTAYQYMKGWNIGAIKNASFIGQPAGFTVTSLNSAQNAFVPGIEFFVRGNNGVFASVNYEGEFAGKFLSNSVLAKIGLFF